MDKRMLERYLKKRSSTRKKAALIALSFSLALYTLYAGSHFVTAFQEEKQAHIFPTQLNAIGWGNAEGARELDLASDAPAESFAEVNSAYILATATPTPRTLAPEPIAPVEAPPPVVPAPAPTEPPTPGPAPPDVQPVQSTPPDDEPVETSESAGAPEHVGTSTSASQSDTGTSEKGGVENLVEESTPDVAEDEPASPETSRQGEAGADASQDGPSQDEPPEATSAPEAVQENEKQSAGESESATSTADTSEEQSALERLREYTFALAKRAAKQLFARLVETALASTTEDAFGSSTTPASLYASQGGPALISDEVAHESVAACDVTGSECHTFAFSGFQVGGELTEKRFERASVSLSLAAHVPEGAEGGTLTVRYLHRGAWKSAAALPAGDLRSNAHRGGYFTALLEGVSSWDELASLRIEIEYEGGDNTASIFLDSLWVDAVYMDRAQDIIAGDVDAPEDAPQNISFDPLLDADPALLLQGSGERISFPYASELHEGISVRAHKAQYLTDGGSTIAYISIANLSPYAERVRLSTAFPGGLGEVKSLERYRRGAVQGESGTSTRGWVPLPILDIRDEDHSSDPHVPDGYVPVAAVQGTLELEPGSIAYFRYTMSGLTEEKASFAIVAAGQHSASTLDSQLLQDTDALVQPPEQKQAAVAGKKARKLNEELSVRKEFSGDELPAFKFRYKTQRSLLKRVSNFLTGRKGEFAVGKTLMRDADGKPVNAPFDVVYGEDGEWKLEMKKLPRAFRPGKYSVELQMQEDVNTYTDSVEFYWGLLAVNTHKSIYEPHEEAALSLAALDDHGNTLCDALLELAITAPSGETQQVPVVKSGYCGGNNVTDTPDYLARYTVQGAGEYAVSLIMRDESGAVLHRSYDAFFVRPDMPFSIERKGPTRIWPKAPYEMEFTVHAMRDFSGTLTEIMPAGFTVTKHEGGSFALWDGGLRLSWELSMRAGEERVLTYEFDAPNVSPYLFTLGPARLDEETRVAFEEARTWKIASDALGDIGHWRDSAGSQIPGTSFAGFNFAQQVRNDGIYSRPDNATIELDQAGDYLIVATIRNNDTSNDRTNIQSRIAQTSGSGSLFTSYYTGYSRDTSEDDNWTKAVGVIIGATADSQIQVQTRRDADAPTGGSVAYESDVQVIRIYQTNYGIYAIGGSGNAYGGTSPNTVDLTSVTAESNTLFIQGSTTADSVTVKGDNKRYLVAWSVSGNTAGNRTQRIGHLEYDGTDDLATRSYCYQREANDEYCGLGSMDVLEATSTDRTIQVEVFRGPGVAADQGGADDDGSWVTDSNGQMVVLELPDSMDVFRSHDSTGLQNITSAVTLNAMRNVDFNDAASFTQSSNSALNVVNAGDVFVWANVWTARNDASGGNRLTAYGTITINGVATTTGRHGNYTRGDQAAQGTFAGSFHPGGIYTISTAGHDIGVNMDPLSGTEGGGNDRTQAGTVGFFALNLDLNAPPDPPSQDDAPFISEKTGASTPSFFFTASDPDGTSDLVYQIQWDDDPILDDAPVGDHSSDDESGCSPRCFINLNNGLDFSPFAEGDQVGFTIPTSTPLTTGVTYYWRVRATDVTGSGAAGEWSDVRDFTYVQDTNPSQWYQSEDTQFEQGTLTDTETFGQNSVRIVTSAPVEALVAYGEGTVQTPRYRMWDGDSWSSENSASSVGGTIQWMSVAAGTQRNEYILGTQDDQSDVNVQVFNADSSTWTDLTEVTGSISNTARRGFDVAFESQSGRGMVVYCDGDADPSYRTWDGADWSSPNTIDLTSANNCEWIRLASDPVDDEIIVVSRDTGALYEAQVWDGGSDTWGHSVTMGSMTEAAHEGIGVEYEDSGNQAVVAVSNGNNPSMYFATWDGDDWSIPATHTLQNDFEWGIIKRDDGTDQMALCYADQDDDLGVVWWDGDGWQAYQEFDGGGNIGASGQPDGRPISCEFEITTGRDGYLMIPYSDTGAGRSQYMDDPTGFSGEASLSTIQDSWTVSSARTGEGKVLALFHDDVNALLDFSYWDGTTWASKSTLESSPSVTADPFLEPHSMAARVFQASAGTIMSPAVDFNILPDQVSWGEALWNVTEPVGTDVVVQVFYGSSCSSLVPDAALPGNSNGFQATSSPLDLTSLDTGTYQFLCLRASLSSTNQNNPTLDDWTLSWERQPYLTQQSYRWYVNTDAATTSDPWPSGGTDLNEDAAITASEPVSFGSVLRLRMGILNSNVALATSTLKLRLQYAQTDACSAISTTWHDVGPIGSSTVMWRGYNNASVADASTLSSLQLADSDIRETYEEENDATSTPNAISAGNEGEWDWVIQHNASSSLPFCFRAVTAQGDTLQSYGLYPSLITNDNPEAPALENPFDNEKVGTTSPHFEFAAADPEANDITYQIQVDDDYAFGSPALDRNSQTNFTEFENITTPADKDPFTSEEVVRYTPTSALSNNTTYYWRVRARDRNASTDWSDWSGIYSFTTDTAVTVTTWHQTRDEQFATDSLEDTQTSGSHTVVLVGGFTLGTTTSPAIDFDWKSTGNAWGTLSWTDTETSSDLKYHIEYLNGGSWELIPDSDLAGNAAGFDTSGVSLLSLSPTTYNELRIRANFTNSGASPVLSDWTLSWGLAVEEPAPSAPFDNEKVSTTTPSFRFVSTDPQGDSLVYQISWATTTDFAASTTRSSNSHTGFTNVASSTDTSPFEEGDIINFKIQQSDALQNGETYWWRARARDPSGSDTWSTWSDLRSFTVDTSVTISTWFQTTDEQFETDSLNDTEVYGSDSVRITALIREALVAYAEGTVQAPRYRIWNGSEWGDEETGENVGDTIRFVEAAAAPTRDEYVVVTQTATGIVDAQVFTGASSTFSNLAEIVPVVPGLLARGMDVAYESLSGDAIVVACNGTEAMYREWKGTYWEATTTITLATTGNCNWVKLAADPTSNELILVVRSDIAGGTDYEALVWNGTNTWNNSMTLGSMAEGADEGIAVEYEESGDRAVVVVSNGGGASFAWNSWTGAGWTGPATQGFQDDFENGRLVRDLGSDNMVLCGIDQDGQHNIVRWTGSSNSWNAYDPVDATGNSKAGRPHACEFETTSGRDGYIMVAYSDTTDTRYQVWNGGLSGESTLSTISDSWEVRSTRTGDGNILVVAYDDTATEYDFSYWNGTQWSTEEIIEGTSIATLNPRPVPIDIVARRYTSFASGSVVGTPIDFDDGVGLKWSQISFNDTTPGASNIYYQLQYLTSTSSWELIPDSDMPGNSTGSSTSPIDISNLSRITYNVIRPVANFVCNASDCPTLQDWTVRWSEGLLVSGTAKQYDETTNVTSGTVHIAVNGTLQTGKTGTISGGVWSISNVAVFEDDVVTVFIDGAGDESEAIAVTKYDGVGDISGLELIERHLTIGSNDNTTVSNADLALFDNTNGEADEDIFHNVDASNDLAVCAIAGCENVELWIRSGSTYRPDSASSGNVSTHDIEINGTLRADANTITVGGSWDNDGVFTSDSSLVVFSATSTTERIDSTGATTTAFYAVTFGSGSGTARFELLSPLNASSTLSINYGTLAPGATTTLRLDGSLAIGASGVYQKNQATTTFMGTGSNTWSDASASKQDMGTVVIDGSTKTITLGSAVKATDITIGGNDTLDVSGSHHALEVTGNWTNNNSFNARSGTVTFTATTSGKVIAPGGSNFFGLTFNGSGGNWSFNTANITVGGNLTFTTGIVTMPTGTTTVSGSLSATGGTFMHNNGAVLFDGSGSKTINSGANSFYDLAFNGSGSWTFQASATSTRSTLITAGTVTLPSGTLAVGDSFINNGTFVHNSGTIRMDAASVQRLSLGSSSAFNLTFAGSGTWTLSPAFATSSGTVRFQNGTAILPTGTFAIGGSLINEGGAFSHNFGKVIFSSTSAGNSVTPGSSSFYDIDFNGAGGSWNITQSATSTHDFALRNANGVIFAGGTSLEVQGSFTNLLQDASTTWSGATLFLNGGGNFTINTKTQGSDTYDTIRLGPSTYVRAWNSSYNTPILDSASSLFSQDHASIDGTLYIYGAYTSTTGEYWSYATDFDGTALGVASRQVNVRIASSSVVNITSGFLQMLGTSTATTTVGAQSSGGAYDLSISKGDLNARYYAIASTSLSGFSISGTTTITSLQDGEYTLTVSGGTSLTVASTTIDANPELQIPRVRFATSSTALSGYNVTATGTASSYWWFRDSYGPFDGEGNDNDPDGDPGYIRWDDSAFDITVSGIAYADHGATPLTGANVSVVVSGVSYSDTTDGSGYYEIPGVQYTGDVSVIAYLNTGGGARGASVTRTPTGDISGMDIYQNALIVRHEFTSPLTIEELAYWDSTDDSDVPFAAATTSTDTLSVSPGTELYVWQDKTFAPGGNVELQSGGSGSVTDGRFFLATSSTFTAVGAQTHSIGGGFVKQSGATFTAANSTFTFTATTSGKSIYSTSTITFYDLAFNGPGGTWSLDNGTAAVVAQNSFAFTAGTLTGAGDLTVQAGGVTGGGVFQMTGGTVRLQGTGNFGNSNPWQFNNLTFGSGSSASSTKTSTATTTVSGVLTISGSYTLHAGYGGWDLSGSGTPFVRTGTFRVMSAPWRYSGTSATNVTPTTYDDLYLAPSAAGAPVYTMTAGIFTVSDLFVGDGVNAVTVNADSQDPSTDVNGSLAIRSGAAYTASSIGALTVGGSWSNAGTFTHSGAEVVFDSGDVGETVDAGVSYFYDLTFDNDAGGWSVIASATTTHDLTVASTTSFMLGSGAALSVWGTFTNVEGGAATTWDGTLYLRGGGSYTINTKGTGADTYGSLIIASSTKIRMWNSSSTAVSVDPTGSLYSQDHAAQDGDLYIWGAYTRSSGSDYWSYATDFDGTSLGGSSRQVDVRIASSSTVSFSGGVLDIIGGASATTTVQAIGSVGAYGFAVSGGTFTANYYLFRDLDRSGINLSGAPTISSLTYGDLLMAHPSGGTLITVASTTINANPLKIIKNVKFATTTAVLSGANVTERGTTTSSWKFNLHYGGFDGEEHDNDPAGDPGYLRWDNSSSSITFAGRVYSGEGSGVSGACDDGTPVVHLVIAGASADTVPCSSGDGSYEIENFDYNPGDPFIVYLDTGGQERAAMVSTDPITSAGDMDLYEHRVIVRHEDSSPLTIADMAVWDSSDDPDIPFTAVDSGSDTLTLPPDTKLIVWDNKTFAPAGNITLQSGGSGNAWDGSLEVYAGGALTASGSQAHSVGGSFVLRTGASFTAANSTITFTATTTGKTITPQSSSFYNIVFDGGGGNWAFSGSATTTNNLSITRGTVTLPSGTLYVGGSFQNAGATGGVFMHNNGALILTATTTGKTIAVATSTLYDLRVSGSGGGWTFSDTYATTSHDFIVSAGSITLPSGTFTVGNAFQNAGTFTHGGGTVKLTSTVASTTLQAGGSSFNALLFDGVGGGWNFLDTNATAASDFTIATGTVRLPAGTLTVGGSFVNEDGTFYHATGTVSLNASATGKSITAGGSDFYNLTVNGGSGGWTITDSATTTHDTTLTAAAKFTIATGTTYAVGGTFTNSVGGGATWLSGASLYLYSQTSYSVNAKTTSDLYGPLIIATSTHIRMWNSSSTAVTVDASGSLYSQDHADVAGALNIWGAYTRSSGTDYWSYATDFDGVALGGSSRRVYVRIASSSALAFSGGTLNIVGTATASTTIAALGGTGAYAWQVSGGTLNAQYYVVRNTDQSGLVLSGAPTISSLNYGDFELTASSTMLTLAGTVVDANSGKTITGVRFGTSTGVTAGTNVALTSAPVSLWTFTGHWGERDGENYDGADGGTCGNIRWDDSSCLLLSEAHYRWRNDDGGEGAPSSEWYESSWSKRKRLTIANANANNYTNIPVKVDVTYDGDMNSNFTDLRFTDSSGTTSIPYWIESSITSATSTVWVRVPSLPASSQAVVYMYYGTSTTQSLSSSTSTFSFIDDFEDDNITEYSGSDSTDFDVKTGSGSAYHGTYGLSFNTDATARTESGGIYRTGSQTAQGMTIRFLQRVVALSEDEPCTKFGLQSASANYAVCLDELGGAVRIVKDVTDRDDSGSLLASTDVTWATGWYEVQVDWLTDNSINVNVYDTSGSLFASVNTTNSSYTSGGMGFSYWGQHGAWDSYMAYPYTATDPTYNFGIEQQSDGASWKVAEDTTLTGQALGENVRLRFSIHNTGSDLSSQNFRLQVASKTGYGSCEAVPYGNFSDVPTTSGGCGSAVACMKTSSQFTDQGATTPHLSYPAAMSFAAGKVLEDPSNQTNSMDLNTGYATEVEYNFELTNFALASSYCFRSSKAGSNFDAYDKVAEVSVLHGPVITDVRLNSDSDIALSEGTSTIIYATSTITDLNGYQDIIYGTSTIYRSGVGHTCSANTNNCYQISSSVCTLENCAGNSCTLSCRAYVQYHADPTDDGSAYEADDWVATMSAEDSTGYRDTEDSAGVELLTLYGLSIDVSGIDFGTHAPGENTGTVLATTTVRNTGNTNIDVKVSGDDLTSASDSIPVGAQRYATSTFQYGTCSICAALSGTATNVQVVIPKPTSTSTPEEDEVYWGINVPIGSEPESYTGTNYFVATAPGG